MPFHKSQSYQSPAVQVALHSRSWLTTTSAHPDREESRGPFDAPQLLTLAEAGQITENTLHYDESKRGVDSHWSQYQQLKAESFPRKRKKLSLKSKLPEPPKHPPRFLLK